MTNGKLGLADMLKHCIMEWIKQDSSKGQCPMCRQSESDVFRVFWGIVLIVSAEFEWGPEGGLHPQDEEQQEPVAEE